ncbi:MAG: hypothetical protein HY900_02620 [Deltaproteobacteria bacterium]|nr:hypothetical protein [Deltaproteobacteria bacterium]
MRVSLAKKITGLTLLFLSVAAATVSYLSVRTARLNSERRIEEYRRVLLAERKQALRNYSDMASRLLADQSLEDARRITKRLKYGDNGYFSIHDLQNLT